MARLFFKHLAICNIKNLPNSIIFFAKVGSKVGTILNKPSKIAKMTKFSPIWSHCLQAATTYTCDDHDRVICKHGWRRSDYPDWIYRMNPCPVPICDFGGDGMGCVNGVCIAPQICSCNDGWSV